MYYTVGLQIAKHALYVALSMSQTLRDLYKDLRNALFYIDGMNIK